MLIFKNKILEQNLIQSELDYQIFYQNRILQRLFYSIIFMIYRGFFVKIKKN